MAEKGLTCLAGLFTQMNSTERDSGVLCGNWSGKYDDGVAPYAWNGSSAILEEFLKKRKGVKFGQCWTFAAVATTCEFLFCRDSFCRFPINESFVYKYLCCNYRRLTMKISYAFVRTSHV